MNLHLVESYPAVCDQEHSSVGFSFFYNDVHDVREGLLVYEAQRDFLSTPRAFVRLRVELGNEVLFCSGGNLLTDDQLAHLKTLPYGLYGVSGSEYCASEKGRHYVCYSPKVIFEFCAEQIFLLNTVYGCHSVQNALTASQ